MLLRDNPPGPTESMGCADIVEPPPVREIKEKKQEERSQGSEGETHQELWFVSFLSPCSWPLVLCRHPSCPLALKSAPFQSHLGKSM